MEHKKTADQLLGKLISHWCVWDKYEKFYLESLAPQLTEKPETGDETERALLKQLRVILNDNEWVNLPSLIKERRNGKLREIEKEKICQEAERKAKEEEARRREQEKLRAEQRAIKARMEEEIKRQEKEKALSRVKEWFESDFLRADSLYEEQYSEIIFREEYEAEKARFVRSWIKAHTKAELDSEQSTAIASYGKHIQVIARAGSGKTTTLVNRAIFLQKHCHLPPNQLILLAFNRKAAEEIKERLEEYFGDSIPHVMTFHALAYAIVHPEEALLFDDPANNSLAKSRSLQYVIDDFLRDPKFKEKIRLLMLEHFRTDWERIVSGGYNLGKSELIEYRRSLPNVSLRGEYLKSHGEKLRPFQRNN